MAVFSVQLSSRQDLCGMSNEDGERFGIPTASLATENGVEHLVYASVSASVLDPPSLPGEVTAED